MSRPVLSRLSLASAALAVGLSSTACVDIIGADLGKYVEREEKRFQTAATPDVDLSTFDGSIEIRPWDRPEVLVVIEKRGHSKTETDDIEVVAHQDGNRVTLEAKLPDGVRASGLSWHNNFASAKLIASVPATSNITARSGDGSIDIERLTGQFDLQSGDGSILARGLKGGLRAHTGDGSLKIEDAEGTLDVDTGDGSVIANGTFTLVRARSGDGSVRVQAAPGSAASEDWNITTGDGSVTLELPDGFGGELDAHTGDGGIRASDLSMSNTSGGGRHDRNTLRGTLGSGGHTVRVRTGDGSITLRRF